MDKQSDFKKKWENYWYYYKYHTLLAVFIVIVIIVSIWCVQKRDVPVETTIVDYNVLLNSNKMDELLKEFADYGGMDEESVMFRNSGEFVDDELAERTGTKGLKQSLKDGLLEGIFVTRGNELAYEYVGNIESILPNELMEELGDDVMAGYLVERYGELVETDAMAGIIVNDAKRFKEKFGEMDEYIVLQIPATCQHHDNAIAFIKYLFDIE